MTNKNQTNTLTLEQQLEQLEQQLEQLYKKEVPDDKEKKFYFDREKSELQDKIEKLEDRIENPNETRNLDKKELIKKIQKAIDIAYKNQGSYDSLTIDTLEGFLFQENDYDEIISTLQDMANMSINGLIYDKDMFTDMDKYYTHFDSTIEETLKEFGMNCLKEDNLTTRLYHLYNYAVAEEIASYLNIDHDDIHY